MKKAILALAAALTLAGMTDAQVYYYRTNSRPWDGNKAYSLNVGTDFSITPRDFGELTTDLKSQPGLAASFRYEGDKNINERLAWGYHVELGYLAQNFEYTKFLPAENTSDPTSYLNHNRNEYAKMNWYDLQFDMRLSFAYWVNDNIEVQAAAGLYYGLANGYSIDSHQEYAAGEPLAGQTIEGTVNSANLPFNIFSFDLGVSTMLQAKYFFNENFFVNIALRDNIGLELLDDFASEFGSIKNSNTGHRGIVMAGVGYKFIK